MGGSQGALGLTGWCGPWCRAAGLLAAGSCHLTRLQRSGGRSDPHASGYVSVPSANELARLLQHTESGHHRSGAGSLVSWPSAAAPRRPGAAFPTGGRRPPGRQCRRCRRAGGAGDRRNTLRARAPPWPRRSGSCWAPKLRGGAAAADPLLSLRNRQWKRWRCGNADQRLALLLQRSWSEAAGPQEVRELACFDRSSWLDR